MRVRNVKNADAFLASYPALVISNPSLLKGKWRKFFKNDRPIFIEIGMGKAKFIIEHALRNKDINYIGIEKDTSIVFKALTKYLDTLEEKEIELKNLVFLNIDACNICIGKCIENCCTDISYIFICKTETVNCCKN